MLVAPVSEYARKMVEELVGRPCTDADILTWQRDHHCECRELPLKADVLQAIAGEASGLCRQLADAGVEFAGSIAQAAAIVTGTVYAAWRSRLREDVDTTEPGLRHTAILQAVGLAIDHARDYADGMPAMYRDDYLAAVAGSDDPIDRMPLREVLEALWPYRFPGGQLVDTAAEPAADGGGSTLLDEMIENVPNVFDRIACPIAEASR